MKLGDITALVGCEIEGIEISDKEVILKLKGSINTRDCVLSIIPEKNRLKVIHTENQVVLKQVTRDLTFEASL